MNEPEFILLNGTRIETHEVLGSTGGLMVRGDYVTNRKPSAIGIIRGVVPGHGGDAYWVTHDYGDVAVYCFREFELVP